MKLDWNFIEVLTNESKQHIEKISARETEKDNKVLSSSKNMLVKQDKWKLVDTYFVLHKWRVVESGVQRINHQFSPYTIVVSPIQSLINYINTTSNP